MFTAISRERRRLAVLAALMLLACLGVGAVALGAMYRTAFAQKEQVLLNILRSQAKLVETLALNEEGAGIRELTLALDSFEGLGESGEVILVGHHGGKLDRLLMRRENGRPVVQRMAWSEERLGEPMRRAMAGETGVMVSTDYRQRRVLAAFTRLPSTGHGLVAKIDLDEVRAPLTEAVAITGAAAVVIVVIALLLFARLSGPMLRRLEASEARLRGVVEMAGEGIITVDRGGTVTAFNAAAERMFGYTAAQVCGRPVDRLLVQADAGGLNRLLERFEAMGEHGLGGGRAELIGRREDGSEFPLELAVSEVRTGKEHFYTAIVHDLTVRHTAEQVLRTANEHLEQHVAQRTEALERSNRLLRAIGNVQAGLAAGEAPSYPIILDALITLSGSAMGCIIEVSSGGADRGLCIVACHGFPGCADSAECLDAAGGVIASARKVVTGDGPNGRFLGIALTHQDETVAVAMLAGSADEYDAAVIDYLHPFLAACAQVVSEQRRLRERQADQERLLKYEQELNAILLNVQDVIFRTDLHGTITWVSPSVRDVAGYSPDAVIGRVLSDLNYDPRDHTRLFQALDQGAGRVDNFETRLLRRDGVSFWASASCHYYQDANGTPAGIEGVIRDISGYKSAESRIAVLNSLYSVLSEVNKAIARCSDSGELYREVCRVLVEQGRFRMAWIGELDERGRHMRPAAWAGHVDGYLDGFVIDMDSPSLSAGPAGSALARGNYTVVEDVAEDPRMAAWRERALMRGYRSVIGVPFRRHGEVAGCLMVYAATPHYFNEENIQLLQGLAEDVSYAIDMLASEQQNRVVVEELRCLTEKLSHHIRNTPIAVIEFDDAFRIRQWNPAAERLFGHSAAGIIGQSGHVLAPPDVQDHVAEVFSSLLARQGGWQNVNENVTRDGRRIVCEWYNTLLTDAAGSVTGVMSVGLDITEVVRSRQEILALNAGLERRVEERTRELEVVNRELEAFSYSVSHDLRAPLRTIDGFGELLVKRCADQLDDTARGYLARVRHASRRMGELIDDMLELSRVNRGGMSLSHVDLSALAQEIVDELRQSEPERMVEVAITPAINATADRRLLQVALANLLGNAWKFSARCEHARIEFHMELRGQETVFCVRDNGAGFDMAYAHKLFGAFQRLHSLSEFEGTGVGLATVQRVVHRHGGRIWAESEVNKGAAFYFTLGEHVHGTVNKDAGSSTGAAG